ncbi:hypothetical protein [Novosphingobium sp. 63-713]|jgi:hypothetical protein|uniref:hypothetical protein n=1 Tax=Novosphingobium sp. 63-713 TaxID=1895900 RepID=UPI001AC27A16|nr:hypothetical protein [Novosphingobium sp. 63-713]MBN9144629.1 hypothetical protein [Novosphingobium sp.]
MTIAQHYRFSARLLLAMLCAALLASHGAPTFYRHHMQEHHARATLTVLSASEDSVRNHGMSPDRHQHGDPAADRTTYPALVAMTPHVSLTAMGPHTTTFTAQDHHSELIRPPAIV